MNLILVATLGVVSVALTASQPNVAARQEFAQAMAVSNTRTNDDQDSLVLREYVLYPYLRTARLLARVVKRPVDAELRTLDSDMASFLSQQGTAPVTREPRRAWLLSLAERSEWAAFLKYYVADASDAELRCHWLAAQLVTQSTLDETVLKPVWLSATRLPSSCNGPFDWAKQEQIINAEWFDTRARLALKAGNVELARELGAQLPKAQAEAILQWADLIAKPQAALDALIANPAKNVEPAALQDGWQRLVRKDVDAGIARLPRLIATRKWNAAAASRHVLDLALALSWSRRPEALNYFSRVLPADMTDQAHEWQTRAALWAGDWPRVRRSIDAMPESLRSQVRWRYWLARAMDSAGERGAAKLAFQSLAEREDNYYAALAAAQVASPYTPHPQALQVDAAAMNHVSQLPAVERAGELFAVGMRDAADLEWQSEFANLSVAEKEAAGRLAYDWGWYDQSILTLARVSRFDDYTMLYPRPYDREVGAAAESNGLSQELIYAVMRQETLFRADAKSAANARGLLQLVPVTARQVARREKRALPEPDELFLPEVNVPLGVAYLKSLIDQFGGQTILGLAAYNAGPIAARRWLPPKKMPSDIWIENIPYNETRTYVQRILWHSLIFDWLESHHPVLTQAWLASVQPLQTSRSP